MPFDPIVSRDADLRVWREQFPDAIPIAEVQRRHAAVCVGVVSKIRLVPGRQLEVMIEDGTGRLTAIFTGRSNLPGLELGSALRLEGTVAGEANTLPQMRNPTWGPVAEPYA